MLVLAVVIGTSGCTNEEQLVSNLNPVSNDTWEAQQSWALWQMAGAIEASGLPDGWFDPPRGEGQDPVAWPGPAAMRDHDLLFPLFPENCGGGGAQVILSLFNTTEVDDTRVVSDRLWEFWIAEGWAVNWVTPPHEDGLHFRADRDDGAMLSFTVMPKQMVISVSTRCSVNVSVTHWDRPWGEIDELEDELARRDQEAESEAEIGAGAGPDDASDSAGTQGAGAADSGAATDPAAGPDSGVAPDAAAGAVDAP